MICFAMAHLVCVDPACPTRALALSDILLAATLTHQASTRIQICGRLAVEISGQPVTELIPKRQGRLLFIFLVLNRHRNSSREELVDALWADEVPPDADGTLS